MRSFLPDVLVFMGDLMDEGSISTTAQFHNYAKRLFNIFYVQYPVTVCLAFYLIYQLKSRDVWKTGR